MKKGFWSGKKCSRKGGNRVSGKKNLFYCSIRFNNNLKRKFICVYLYGFFHFLEKKFCWKPLPSSFFPTKRLSPKISYVAFSKVFLVKCTAAKEKKGFLSRHLVSSFSLFISRSLFAQFFAPRICAKKKEKCTTVFAISTSKWLFFREIQVRWI